MQSQGQFVAVNPCLLYASRLIKESEKHFSRNPNSYKLNAIDTSKHIRHVQMFIIRRMTCLSLHEIAEIFSCKVEYVIKSIKYGEDLLEKHSDLIWEYEQIINSANAADTEDDEEVDTAKEHNFYTKHIMLDQEMEHPLPSTNFLDHFCIGGQVISVNYFLHTLTRIDFETGKKEKIDVNDSITDVQTDGKEWLYFTTIAEGNLFRVNVLTLESEKISDAEIGHFRVRGDWLYCTEYSETDHAIFRMRTNGTHLERISINGGAEFAVSDTVLFFASKKSQNEGTGVYAVALDGSQQQIKISDDDATHLSACGNAVYYISDSYLYRVWRNGKGRERLVNSKIYSYKIVGTNIIFQKLDNKNRCNGTFMMNIEGGRYELITYHPTIDFALDQRRRWLYFANAGAHSKLCRVPVGVEGADLLVEKIKNYPVSCIKSYGGNLFFHSGTQIHNLCQMKI